MEKRRWPLILVLPALIGLGVALAPRRQHVPAETTESRPGRQNPAGETPFFPLQQEMEFAMKARSGTNLLSPNQLPKLSKNMPLEEQESYAESLLGKIDPEALKKYEGSHTLGELRNQDDSLNVNTAVILGGGAPQAGVTMQRNPESGQYEVKGGEVFLPGPGVGVSYENDAASGESKTFLNLKREF